MKSKGRIPALQFAICQVIASIMEIGPPTREGMASTDPGERNKLHKYFGRHIPRCGISYEIYEISAEEIEESISDLVALGETDEIEKVKKRLSRERNVIIKINGWPKDSHIVFSFRNEGKKGWIPIDGEILVDSSFWGFDFEPDPLIEGKLSIFCQRLK